MEGTIFQTISDFIAVYLPILVSVVGSFALIAAVTPNKTDDKIVQFLLDMINFIACNFGNSANKES